MERAQSETSRVAPSKAAFLSHSSDDSELAQQLCASLEKRGLDCWIAPRDLNVGEVWALACIRGIAESKSLVLLASEKALGSVQVLSEVAQAHKRAKPIYTVLIPPAKVKGEMDFYLSRLHWLPGGGRTPEELAAVLADALAKPLDWNETAAPPSLRRTMQYRPAAFARLVAGVAVALILVLGTAAWTLNHALNQDFRRLGYVDMAQSAESGSIIEAHAQVWLMAAGVPFRDLRLVTATDAGDAGNSQPYTQWLMPDQIGAGSMEPVTLALDAKTRRLTTCLTVLPTGLHNAYRVTQQFALSPASGEIRIAETAEKRVSREDGSPCSVVR